MPPSGPGAPTSTPAESAALKAIVLRKADLPAGYTATPADDDSSDDGGQATLVKCVGGKDTSADETGHASSPTFSKGEELQISSDATSYKSQADVDADIAILKSPKINTCFAADFKSTINRELPDGSTVDSVSFKITPGAAGGPKNVVGTGTGQIAFTTSGTKLQVYISVAFITGALIEATVDVFSVGVPIDKALVSGLVAKVAARTAAA